MGWKTKKEKLQNWANSHSGTTTGTILRNPLSRSSTSRSRASTIPTVPTSHRSPDEASSQPRNSAVHSGNTGSQWPPLDVDLKNMKSIVAGRHNWFPYPYPIIYDYPEDRENEMSTVSTQLPASGYWNHQGEASSAAPYPASFIKDALTIALRQADLAYPTDTVPAESCAYPVITTYNPVESREASKKYADSHIRKARAIWPRLEKQALARWKAEGRYQEDPECKEQYEDSYAEYLYPLGEECKRVIDLFNEVKSKKITALGHRHARRQHIKFDPSYLDVDTAIITSIVEADLVIDNFAELHKAWAAKVKRIAVDNEGNPQRFMNNPLAKADFDIKHTASQLFGKYIRESIKTADYYNSLGPNDFPR